MAFAKIDANQVPTVTTVEEFDALLEKHKKDYPLQHARQEAAGDYEKFRKTLIGYVPPEVEPKEPKPKKEKTNS